MVTSTLRYAPTPSQVGTLRRTWYIIYTNATGVVQDVVTKLPFDVFPTDLRLELGAVGEILEQPLD